VTALEVRSSQVETLDRALTRWLGGLSEHTSRAYNIDLTAWMTWCEANGVDAGHPTGRDVVEHLASLEVGESAKARRYSAIQSFYRWARDEGLTDADPLPPKAQRPVVRGEDSQRRIGLSEADAQLLTAAAISDTPRSAALVTLLFTTGLRISEALSIDQLTRRGDRVTVTVLGKGRKTRTVVVPPLAAELCSKLLESSSSSVQVPLFRTRTGRRLSPREAYKVIVRLGRQAGLEHVHPHLLRHTSATLSLLNGVDVMAVCTMLGHANLNTVQRYLLALAALEHSPADLLASKIAPAPHRLVSEGS
jgi:integrase/recombinase XerD